MKKYYVYYLEKGKTPMDEGTVLGPIYPPSGTDSIALLTGERPRWGRVPRQYAPSAEDFAFKIVVVGV